MKDIVTWSFLPFAFILSLSNDFIFPQSGGKCMVLPTVKPDEIGKLFPKGVEVKEMPSGKQYMRFTPQPE